MDQKRSSQPTPNSIMLTAKPNLSTFHPRSMEKTATRLFRTEYMKTANFGRGKELLHNEALSQFRSTMQDDLKTMKTRMLSEEAQMKLQYGDRMKVFYSSPQQKQEFSELLRSEELRDPMTALKNNLYLKNKPNIDHLLKHGKEIQRQIKQWEIAELKRKEFEEDYEEQMVINAKQLLKNVRPQRFHSQPTIEIDSDPDLYDELSEGGGYGRRVSNTDKVNRLWRRESRLNCNEADQKKFMNYNWAKKKSIIQQVKKQNSRNDVGVKAQPSFKEHILNLIAEDKIVHEFKYHRNLQQLSMKISEKEIKNDKFNSKVRNQVKLKKRMQHLGKNYLVKKEFAKKGNQNSILKLKLSNEELNQSLNDKRRTYKYDTNLQEALQNFFKNDNWSSSSIQAPTHFQIKNYGVNAQQPPLSKIKPQTQSQPILPLTAQGKTQNKWNLKSPQNINHFQLPAPFSRQALTSKRNTSLASFRAKDKSIKAQIHYPQLNSILHNYSQMSLSKDYQRENATLKTNSSIEGNIEFEKARQQKIQKSNLQNHAGKRTLENVSTNNTFYESLNQTQTFFKAFEPTTASVVQQSSLNNQTQELSLRFQELKSFSRVPQLQLKQYSGQNFKQLEAVFSPSNVQIPKKGAFKDQFMTVQGSPLRIIQAPSSKGKKANQTLNLSSSIS